MVSHRVVDRLTRETEREVRYLGARPCRCVGTLPPEYGHVRPDRAGAERATITRRDGRNGDATRRGVGTGTIVPPAGGWAVRRAGASLSSER
jgi:hypothetical protein